MKTFLALLSGAIVLAATAGHARAAGPADARIAALERQVAALTSALAEGPQAAAQTPADRKLAALQKQATALAKRVKTLETGLKAAQATVKETELVAAVGLVLTGCIVAVTADAFTGTWNVIDQIATTAQAKTYFGQQAVVSDFQTCSTLRVTRQQTVPPSVGPFSALAALLGTRLP